MNLDPADLLGHAELAALAGVRPNVAMNWRSRYRDFPKPLVVLKCGPIWHRTEIARWLETRKASPPKERDDDSR